jgi:hypothetical protein
VMVSQLGVAIDVRTTFRNERDLLIQLLRNLVEPEWTADTVCALAGLCATLPRTCYTTTFADSVAAATMSKAQFRRQASHYRPNTAPRRRPEPALAARISRR